MNDLIQPDVLHSVVRKARKKRQCVSCNTTLDPGGAYTDNRGVWEGEWGSYPQCVPCADLMAVCYPYGSFENLIDEVMEDETPWVERPGAVAFMARVARAEAGYNKMTLARDARFADRELTRGEVKDLGLKAMKLARMVGLLREIMTDLITTDEGA